MNKEEHVRNQVIFVTNEENLSITELEEKDTLEDKAREAEFKMDLNKF